MDVMITSNVSTDLDVASGARGNTVKIILDAREEITSKSSQVMELHYPTTYVLVRMIRTKVDELDGLESGVLPITPPTKTFSVTTARGNKITVTGQQLPITPAYIFADYRSQARTIEPPFQATNALYPEVGAEPASGFKAALMSNCLSGTLANTYAKRMDALMEELDRRTKNTWLEFRENVV